MVPVNSLRSMTHICTSIPGHHWISEWVRDWVQRPFSDQWHWGPYHHNADLLSTLGTYISEILIKLQTFSLKKINFKVSSTKWWLFCLCLNMLNGASLYLEQLDWNQWPAGWYHGEIQSAVTSGTHDWLGLVNSCDPPCQCRDQSRYAPSEWETSLQCNNVSHWLGTYLGWSLQCNR